ncbi:TIGR01777 family oxidoreductase [Nonlabens xiamenensis]|uniref:TIGR01777 family oxidoreductase n=1 Tax=Nonlabens xiamenensis TaxID=2341043 RepID=UPI000F607074|nr:TIGR01777 family oxidoreductase [Nonlabens xiamenensis]
MKTIVIAGGSGFLGTALSKYFNKKGYRIIMLSRKRKPSTSSPNNDILHVHWDGKNIGPWVQQLEGAEALINLSGKSVDCRYSSNNRKAILDSRILSTKVLNLAMDQATKKPGCFINSSTATIYIHSETRLNTESNGIIGDDFSMNVAKSWENEFFSKSWKETRKVALRTSIVLGNTGGAFPKLKSIVRCGLGGQQGNGRQMLSWIHLVDFCKGVDHLISGTLEGPVNLTALEPVTNKEFMQALRSQMGIGIGIPQPKWLIELGCVLMRTESELVLKSRNVYPERLLKDGFKFEHPKLEGALKVLVYPSSTTEPATLS